MNYDGIWNPLDCTKRMFIEIRGDTVRYFYGDEKGITYPLDMEIDSINRGHLVRYETTDPILPTVEQTKVQAA